MRHFFLNFIEVKIDEGNGFFFFFFKRQYMLLGFYLFFALSFLHLLPVFDESFNDGWT